MTSLDAALEYAARGWRVFPLPPGSKTPKLKSWQTKATVDPDQIREWWATKPDHGIAIATGKESGLFVLDVDVADDKAGDETIVDLQLAHGDLPPTKTSITGSGGCHYLWRWPEGVDIRNNASTRLGPGLDIRGEGGYIVAPPSVHPYGTCYQWDLGEPDEPVEAPEWLIALVDSKSASAVADSNHTVKRDTTDRPGDLWAQATDWAEILEPDGWTLSHVDRQTGERHWTRPGKNRRDGTSATTGYTDNDHLKVFTSSMTHVGLDPEGVYSKLGYLAATRYGGDHGAAARALADAGWAPPEIAAADVIDLDSLTRTDLEPEEARPLQPLAEPRELPAWPIDVLPDWIVTHITATSARLQTPTDLLAQFALGALSAVCMGHVTVTVPTVGWTEPVNLYLWCALHSGAGKSPAEKAIMGALYDWERRRRDDTADHHKIARAEWRVLQKRAKEAEQTAVMGSDPDASAKLAAAIIAANIPEPKPYRLTVDDATPQVLVQLLGHHEHLAVISAEGGMFDTVASQFGRNTGPAASVDVYLKSWSGDPIQRDRVGGDHGAESVSIANPLLTIALAIQPSVIEKYQATSPELRGRGFFARFMPSIPQAAHGNRTLSTAAAGDPAAETEYVTRLHEIADLAVDAGEIQLSLDDAAVHVFAEWHDRTEIATRETGRLHPLAEMLPKIRSSVLRAAGILAVADGQTTTVDVDTIRRAITIGEYWIAHAMEMERTTDPLERLDDETITAAKQIAAWAERRRTLRGDVEFRPKDIMRGPAQGGRLPGVYYTEDLATPLELLRNKGWIRFVEGNLHDVGVRGAVIRIVLTERYYEGCPSDDLYDNRVTESDSAITLSGSRTSNMSYPLKGEKERNLLINPYTPGPAPTTPEKDISDVLLEIDPEILEHF